MKEHDVNARFEREKELKTEHGIVYITFEDRDKMHRAKISYATVEERLNHNWTKQEAVGLSHQFKIDRKHKIVFEVVANGVPIRIPYEKVKRAKRLGITPKHISFRLKAGWDLAETLNTPPSLRQKRLNKEQLEVEADIKFARSVLGNDARQQAAIDRMRANRLKERKPHLYDGTPQVHGRTKYGKYLFEHIRVGAYKTDCYGRQQLV
ncbi:SA1788 family PVL leukocidin-associated protein [Staphylococcus chromogenes]|uniref:SA1788 family PVL leukocidin-associated protein n=1 Tax=Staphylococcus chromogenes TaxID=46126 RepID=UPI003B006C39